MNVPMWLLVLLVLFAAAGVWALILLFGFVFKMIDSTLKTTKVNKSTENGNKPL